MSEAVYRDSIEKLIRENSFHSYTHSLGDNMAKESKLENEVEKEIEEINFDEMIKDITHPRYISEAKKMSKGLAASYHTYHKDAKDSELSDAEKEEMGMDTSITAYKARPIEKRHLAEDIADKLGLHFARAMNPHVAKEFEKLKKELKEGEYSGKGKEHAKDKLELLRTQLAQMGFDWQKTYKRLSSEGLTDKLRDELATDLGTVYPQYHISRKYLNKITQDHLPKVAEYIGKMDDSFDVKYLKTQTIEDLKSTLAGVADIKRRYKKDEKKEYREELVEKYGSLLKGAYKKKAA